MREALPLAATAVVVALHAVTVGAAEDAVATARAAGTACALLVASGGAFATRSDSWRWAVVATHAATAAATIAAPGSPTRLGTAGVLVSMAAIGLWSATTEARRPAGRDVLVAAVVAVVSASALVGSLEAAGRASAASPGEAGPPGVTAEQRRRAEWLIASTAEKLPQFADIEFAKSRGFHGIGDEVFEYMHLVNWDYVRDEVMLDPDHPESLVYRNEPAGPRLVAAMFIAPTHYRLETAPDVGGALTQWHVHDDLCWTDDPVAPRIGGLAEPGAPCTPPLRKLPPAPMLHVWIAPNPCGPFAGLDGLARGQVVGEHQCGHEH